MKYKIMHIFTCTGRTYTFHDVTIIHDNESALSFTYRAMSDSKLKRGTFYKQNIAGVSASVKK